VIEERRKQDRFLDLHNDDVLWANMIRAHQDLLMLDRKEMTDDVLFDLLRMGILDWEAPNDRLNQTTPAMRHSTAMMMWMLSRVMQLEAKVRSASCSSYDICYDFNPLFLFHDEVHIPTLIPSYPFPFSFMIIHL